MQSAITVPASGVEGEFGPIQVWTIRTLAPAAGLDRLRPLLSPQEREHAARFRFDHHRNSFLAAHGALRILLGRVLDCHPGSVEFTAKSKGKPQLAEPCGVEFNLSHSGDLAMIAIAKGCELGIDIEEMRPRPDLREIALRYFSLEEASCLGSLPAEQLTHAFYLCWTRKEAYIKATGEGLSARLDGFQVTLSPGTGAEFLRLPSDPARTWTLHNLEPHSGYAAALVHSGSRRSVIESYVLNLDCLL